MEWMFQSKGLINHYDKSKHFGTQPIRILHKLNIYMFHFTHPDFRNELENAIRKHGLSNKLNIYYGEEKITFTPHIRNVDKVIEFHETFLSYLWCISHSVYTLYLQLIDFPRVNKAAGFEKYKIDPERIEKAYEVFNYGKSLIVDFVPWDKENLPNPEIYLAEERDYIEQPNIFYTHAVMFILCHEYIHAIRHIDEINSNTFEDSHFIEFEKEADFEAIELIKKGIHPTKINELGTTIGVTIGILAMLYFKPETTGKIHPNVEDRLVTALEQMNLSPDTPCWGIALIGIKLWSEQFGLDLTINFDLSEKDSFYDVIQQIKSSQE
ncbi:hypothetical protein ATE47_15290 [Chryseobacterium sp. IHB B 17019]|uniref:hypothetical protein n=1 Tax=Chryseobacterium sp. IHB B 17019 TaxID=1721091 RepID=UPI00071EB49C|nr:hypothetical protein [Chryseobacterium sp. IHB B 17019]ALR31791.1 hypothetical protein ATE47_15290 [Chryseobacterium sp. IHB B 17019]